MSHRCPVQFCAKWMPDQLLMCGSHWRKLSTLPGGPDLQRAVYAAYDNGAGLLPNGLPGPLLAEAQTAAITAVNLATARRGQP